MKSKDEQIQLLKTRIGAKYDYFTSAEINELYNTALGVYLSSAFPYQKDIVELPDEHIRYLWWIERAMIELIERSGCSSATAYQENGLSITFDGSLISSDLRRYITPKVGVPK